MRATAGLFSIVLAVLMVQPAFTNFDGKAAISTCTKNKAASTGCSTKKPAKPSCSKNKCSKPKQSEEERNCNTGHCNPLLGCPSGNFYLLLYSHITINPLIASKQETILVNDNRISKQLTECFHPPEII